MANQSGNLSSAAGLAWVITSQNDTLTVQPNPTGTYDVEYPLGTMAIVGGSTLQTMACNGGNAIVRCKSGAISWALLDGPETVSSGQGQIAGFRRSGNVNAGVAADLVFSGAGGAGAGKLNTGIDLMIPANTLLAGTSQIRLRFAVRRTGVDTSFLVVRFGSTNGTGDGNTGVAVQFAAGTNPQDYTFDVVFAVSAGVLNATALITAVGVGGTYGSVTELAGPNFAVNNYVTFCISGATTGSYRCVSYDMSVFQ